MRGKRSFFYRATASRASREAACIFFVVAASAVAGVAAAGIAGVAAVVGGSVKVAFVRTMT